MTAIPLSETQQFTFEDRSDAESLEAVLVTLLHGNLNDPAWRSEMRALLARCSDGPFDVSSGDPRFDAEPIVVVTNQQREVLAKCGPVRDARSCFDAIAFAAAMNAVRKMLDQVAV